MKKPGFELGVVVKLLPMNQDSRFHEKTLVVTQNFSQRRFARDAMVGIAPIAAVRSNRQKRSRVQGKLDRAGYARTGNIAIDSAGRDGQEFACRGEIEGPTIER